MLPGVFAIFDFFFFLGFDVELVAEMELVGVVG